MSDSPIIVGLDIGSSKIAASVGRFHEDEIEILGCVKVKNTGFRRGQIVDVPDTVSSISAIMESIEQVIQAPANNVVVGFAGTQAQISRSRGSSVVARPDGVITEADVDRAVEAARAIAIPPNREIIHVLPKSFTVDMEDGVVDPVGMTGIRVEADTHIVSSSLKTIQNLVRAITQADLNIAEMVFSPLSTGELLLNKNQKDSGVALVDIGSTTTSVAIYEMGDLLHAAILPIGANHITNDIAIGLKIPLDIAEKVKIDHAAVKNFTLKNSETIDLQSYDLEIQDKPRLSYLSEIVEARLVEMFLMVREELGRVDRDGSLPAGIILTGGGSQVKGIVEKCKETLNLPCRLGQPIREFSGRVDKLNDPTYATSVGLVLWGLEHQQNLNVVQEKTSKMPAQLGNMGGVVEKARDFFKQLLP